MSTTYTADEFAVRTLRDLGFLEQTETPSAADLAWALETNASEIDLLAALNLPIWNGSEMAIPREYFTTLSRRCGLAIAPAYGLIDLASAQMAMREAERYLTMLAAPRSVEPLALRSNDALPRRGRFNFSTGF